MLTATMLFACGVDSRTVSVLDEMAATPSDSIAVAGGGGSAALVPMQSPPTQVANNGGAPNTVAPLLPRPDAMQPSPASGGAAGATQMNAAGGPAVSAAGAGSAPASPRLALIPQNGFVASTSNDVGIQGSFSVLSDSEQAVPGNTTV